MKKSIFILFFIFNLFVINGFAQATNKLDSLFAQISILKHDSDKIKTYLQIGDCLENNNLDSGLFYYQKAYHLSKEIGLINYQAKSSLYIGVYYGSIDNYKKTHYWYQKALTKYKEIGDKQSIAIILENIGMLYFYQSEYKEALKYCHESLKYNEEINNQYGIAENLGDIGIFYLDQANYKKALEYYFKALAINKQLKEKWGIAANLGNIGIVYHEQEDYDQALVYYQKALRIQREIEDKDGIATNLGNIGIVYYEKKDYKNALDLYNKAITIQKEINDEMGIVNSLGNIGDLYNKLGQYRKAIEYENKSLDLAKRKGFLILQKHAYLYLFQSYKGLGNYKKAVEYQGLWVEIKDSIFNYENTKIIAEVNSKYESEKKEKKILQQKASLKNSQLENDKKKIQRNLSILAVGLMFILTIIVLRSYKQKHKANHKLLKQNREITEQKDQIEEQKNIIQSIHTEFVHSIDYATRLQNAILPNENILKKYLTDYFVLFKPKDSVSGDFYWWTHIEGHTVITAADCTGHGVPGAFMSMLGISFLREIVTKEYIYHTGVILRKLRKEIIKSLKQTGKSGTQKDGMDMAIISIDHSNNTIQYSGANNQLYIIKNTTEGISKIKMPSVCQFVNSVEGFELYEVKPDKMPIGIYERMDKFKSHDIPIEKGDQLYVFSDGYVDQFGGEKGKKFKYKAFKNLFLQNAALPMHEQKEIFNNTFNNWKQNEKQIDDVVIVGIKI